MQQRRGTSSEWQTVADTVILAAGEIGLETDTNRYKVGDGTSSWSNLSYFISDDYNSQTYAKLTANQSFVGTQQMVSPDSSAVPLVAKGLTNHENDLQQWSIEDSVDNEPVVTVMASVDKDGKITSSGLESSEDITLVSADPDNPKRIRGLANFFDHPDEAVSKAYVDTAGSGIAVKPPVRAATTSNLTSLSGTITVDGVSLSAGNRVLVKNQSDATQNGIYVVAGGSWTRATDTNSEENTKRGTYVFVESGTQNQNTSWVLYSEGTGLNGGIDFGTDPLQFELFFNPGELTTGDGLTKTGPVISAVGVADKISVGPSGISIADTYSGQSSITTVGTIASGIWNGSAISVANGGTGATSLTGFIYGNGTGSFTANPLIDGAAIGTDINVRSANVTGIVAINNGGTNGTTPEQARENLGVFSSEQVVTSLSLLVPAGSIIQFGGASAPTGYVLCDGSEYDKVGQYAALFAAIGGQYGQTTTRFRVPNLKGRVPVGRDASQTEFDTLGEIGGEKTHTLSIAQMPSHNHGGSTGNSLAWFSNEIYRSTTANTSLFHPSVWSGTFVGYDDAYRNRTNHNHSIPSQGQNQPHNNLQPYIVLNYIIKF
jgi:microcystin-dependent protein